MEAMVQSERVDQSRMAQVGRESDHFGRIRNNPNEFLGTGASVSDYGGRAAFMEVPRNCKLVTGAPRSEAPGNMIEYHRMAMQHIFLAIGVPLDILGGSGEKSQHTNATILNALYAQVGQHRLSLDKLMTFAYNKAYCEADARAAMKLRDPGADPELEARGLQTRVVSNSMVDITHLRDLFDAGFIKYSAAKDIIGKQLGMDDSCFERDIMPISVRTAVKERQLGLTDNNAEPPAAKKRKVSARGGPEAKRARISGRDPNSHDDH
jgi:hypothetical protein